MGYADVKPRVGRDATGSGGGRGRGGAVLCQAMNYSGDFRFVEAPPTDDYPGFDGFTPLDAVLAPLLDAVTPSWRSHPAIAHRPRHEQARAAAFDLAVAPLHDAVRACRRTRKVALVVGDTLFVHAGLLAEHVVYAGSLEVCREAASCNVAMLWRPISVRRRMVQD